MTRHNPRTTASPLASRRSPESVAHGQVFHRESGGWYDRFANTNKRTWGGEVISFSKKAAFAAVASGLILGLLAGCTSGNSKPRPLAVSPASGTAATASTAPVTAAPTAAASRATALPARSPVATGNRLSCFAGLTSYNFKGRFALNLTPGATPAQIGSLANLLADAAFDGAFQAPNSSSLNVHFGGAANSQDLETIRVGDKFFQRAAGGAWQENAGAGPILGTLSQLDPQRLCDQTIAQINVSNIKPVADIINGVKTEHYTFGPADLAGTPGLFGQGGQRRQGNTNAQNTPPDMLLDVWTSNDGGYPVRIVLTSSFGDGGGSGTSTLAVSMDIGDFNGSDISIKAPQ